MIRCIRLAALLGVLAALPARAAFTPPGADPDWPCQQIRIADLQPGADWTGPPLDEALKTWSDDAEVARLAPRLAERRLPLDQARTETAAFAQAAGAQKQAKLVALFAGVFQTLNAERDSVVDGLDRFGRRQKEFAKEIQRDEEKLRVLQDGPSTDNRALGDLTTRVSWETQIFKDRQQSVSTACDVPTTIEQRLFALARIIEGELH